MADGTVFSRTPDRLVRYLCSGLGLEYSDRMVNGWTRPFVNVARSINPNLHDTEDAWIIHAATSHGVEATDHAALTESVLPPALRDHLIEVAVPTYEMFMRAFYSQEHLAQYRLGADDHRDGRH